MRKLDDYVTGWDRAWIIRKSSSRISTILRDATGAAYRFPAARVTKYVQEIRRRAQATTSVSSSMYARGMTTREIQGHVRDAVRAVGVAGAGLERFVRPTPCTRRSGKWQSRPLEDVYAVVYAFDAIRGEGPSGRPRGPGAQQGGVPRIDQRDVRVAGSRMPTETSSSVCGSKRWTPAPRTADVEGVEKGSTSELL